MEDLNAMAIFAEVVEAGSFSEAARRMGMAKSAVSQHVARLEKQIGVRLMHRTTRRLSLTEAGETFYASCAQILTQTAEARRQVSRLTEEIAGNLRISCPVVLGNERLVPLIMTFARQHPELKIELRIDDQIENVVEEGIDVAIRVGWLADSGLLARKLMDSPRVICASPAYLRRQSPPQDLQQLAGLDWVIFTRLPTPHRHTLTRQGRKHTISVKGQFKTNNALTLRALLLEGAGIGVLAEFIVGKDIAAGRLVRVLPEYAAGAAGVYAVYQDRHYRLAKVQRLIEFLVAHLGRDTALAGKDAQA